jgi:hypothetical protein
VGADASSAPADATTTGTLIGDTVVSVTNLSAPANVSAVFEATVTAPDKVHQTSTNLSAAVCLFVFHRA